MTQSRLRLSQSCDDLRAGESARALRVKRMLDQIVISRVAQLYHNRWVDRLNINERAISSCADRHEDCRQRNKQPSPNLVARSVHRLTNTLPPALREHLFQTGVQAEGVHCLPAP